jgi:ATP/ADP translocase
MMRKLPREWKYLDIGIIIGIMFGIASIVFFALSLFRSEKEFIIAVILGVFSILVTIIIGYLGTRAIKKEL